LPSLCSPSGCPFFAKQSALLLLAGERAPLRSPPPEMLACFTSFGRDASGGMSHSPHLLGGLRIVAEGHAGWILRGPEGMLCCQNRQDALARDEE